MSYIGKGVEVVTFNTATTLDVAGNITVGGTVDGRDVATDGTKLDTIAANAIANLSEDATPQLGGNLDLNTSNVIGTGNINVIGSITGTSFVSTGDMSFTNNSKAIFGTSPSLEIYHDGSNSILDDVGAGNFKMQLAGADKLEITSTGVDVTGVITTDGMTTSAAVNFGDNNAAIFGTGGDLTINHDGSNSYITDSGTGNLYLQASNALIIRSADGGETLASFHDDNLVRLYYDNAVKLTTSSTGVDVTGTVQGDALVIDGNSVFNGNAFIDQGAISGNTLSLDRTGADGTLGFFNSGTQTGLISGVSGGGINAYVGSTPSLALAINGSGHITQTGYTAYGTSAIGYIGDANNLFAGSASDFAIRGTANVIFGIGASEKMRINSSGNVGIGTTSIPTGKLAVEGGIYLSGSSNFLRFGADSSTPTGVAIHRPAANVLGFATASTERLRIDSSGNVGIGVVPETTYVQKTTLRLSSTASLIAGTSYYPYPYYVANNLNYDASDNLKYIASSGGALLSVNAHTGGSFSFYTAPAGTAGATASLTERMRIDTSGNVTMPNQPAFHVYHTLSASSNSYIAHNAAIVNNGNHYNATNGKFTAPVAGNYMFYATGLVQPTGLTSRIKLIKNGSTTVSGESRHQGGTAGAYLHATIQAVVSMAANDWVQQYYINDDGSTTLYSDGTPYITFGGHLIG